VVFGTLIPGLTLYDLQDDFDWRPLAVALGGADDALVRLDERLHRHPLAESWAARLAFHEACASVWADGGQVHLEDLVLADALMSILPSNPALACAAAVLRVRRLAHGAGACAFSEDGLRTLRELSGRPGQAGKELAGISGEGWDEEERFSRWWCVLVRVAEFPPVLAAAIAYDAWLALTPFHHDLWLGRQLVAAELQRSNKGVASSSVDKRRTVASRNPPHTPGIAGLSFIGRIMDQLRGIEAGAVFGMKELDRQISAR
jgi:hypothetical protein